MGAPPSTDPLPETFGSYRLQRAVAQNAFGTLYEGVHPDTGQQVAVQVLPPSEQAASSPGWRFWRRRQAPPALDHPNIAAVLQSGWQGARPFVVSEWVEGETLVRLLARLDRLPLLQGMALVAQLLSALAFAHARGQVHGALYPGHVFVLPTGQLKVSGFGLAATWHERREPGPSNVPAYLAPEQQDRRSPQRSADLYSAALVAHVLLAGGLPGAATRALAPALQAVFDRALARDPAHRYPDAASLSAALREAVGEPSWHRPPPAVPQSAPPPVRPAPAATVPAAAAAPKPPLETSAVPALEAPSPAIARRRAVQFAGAGIAALALAFGALHHDERSAATRALGSGPTHPAVVSSASWDRPTAQAILPDPPVLASPVTEPAAPATAVAGHPAAESPAPTPAPPQVQHAAVVPSAPRPQEPTTARARPAAVATRSVSSPAAARRPDSAVRVASLRRGSDLGCLQEAAFTREVCKAVRCASSAYQQHPVCVRLSDEQRAANARREMLGGR